MKFNVNNEVRVRLTDTGRTAHRKNFDALYHSLPTRSDGKRWPVYVPPKEDKQGWSKWQLWDLMREFGAYMHNGSEVPFETTIEIIEPVE